MELPLVSIITPCYNSEEFLYRLLDSILEQTYNNIELIIVDDGSTDNTKNVIDSYAIKFKERKIPLKYLYQENKGQAAAINNALSMFKGDYLTWPDSDDFLDKNSVFDRVMFLEKNPEFGLVRCNGNYVYIKNQTITSKKRISNIPNRFNIDIFDDLLFKKTFIMPVSYMIRAKAFQDIYPNRRIYETKSGQNYQMLLPIACKYKCGFIDKDLSYILVRKDSHSRHMRPFDKRLWRINDVEKTIKETLQHCNCNQELYNEKISVFYARQKLQLGSKYHETQLASEMFRYLKNKNKLNFYDRLYFIKGKYTFFDGIIKAVKLLKKS